MLNPLLLVPAPKENLGHPSFLTRERAEGLLRYLANRQGQPPLQRSRDLCLVGLMALAGLFVLLPYVGVILSTTPALFVAFLGTDEPFLALKVVLFYSVVQFLEGNVLTPFIVGSRVKLHPLAVLVAFLFWGILWGLPGAILAVPLTATIKVVGERFDRFAPWAALLGERTPDPEPEPAAGDEKKDPDKEPVG